MDLVAACSAFVSVTDRGSFTVGAAAAGMQQSVASRRIAALESRLGEALFDRSTRRLQLTDFGRGVLSAARRVTLAAAEFEAQARRSRSAVIRIAVPTDCAPVALGAFVAACRDVALDLEIVSADPDARRGAFASGAVQAAVVPTSREEALWTVRLGVASQSPAEGAFFLASIRPSRAHAGAPVRLLYDIEDDVPGIRDPLVALGDSQALAPAQLARAGTPTATVADVLSGDLLLCSQARAAELGFSWSPLGDLDLVRAYTLASSMPGLMEKAGGRAADLLSRALGEGPQ